MIIYQWRIEIVKVNGFVFAIFFSTGEQAT